MDEGFWYRVNKAEKMYQRALQGKKEVLGLDHASTLDTVNNLGYLFADQGKPDEAEKMYQGVLARIREIIWT